MHNSPGRDPGVRPPPPTSFGGDIKEDPTTQIGAPLNVNGELDGIFCRVQMRLTPNLGGPFTPDAGHAGLPLGAAKRLGDRVRPEEIQSANAEVSSAYQGANQVLPGGSQLRIFNVVSHSIDRSNFNFQLFIGSRRFISGAILATPSPKAFKTILFLWRLLSAFQRLPIREALNRVGTARRQ